MEDGTQKRDQVGGVTRVKSNRMRVVAIICGCPHAQGVGVHSPLHNELLHVRRHILPNPLLPSIPLSFFLPQLPTGDVMGVSFCTVPMDKKEKLSLGRTSCIISAIT